MSLSPHALISFVVCTESKDAIKGKSGTSIPETRIQVSSFTSRQCWFPLNLAILAS